jgi:hypothetical protein
MIFESHFLSMVVYAALVAVVLALLRRKERKPRIRYGIFGWLMYLFTL